MSRRTSTSSQDSEDSLLPLGALDSAQSPSAKATLGAGVSLKERGLSRSTRTLKRSTAHDTGELTFSQEDHLASRRAVPGTSAAQKMTVGSGKKLSACVMKSSRMASFSKRLLESSTWTSTEYLLRWSGAATRFRHSIFRLVPWGARSFDTDSGLSASWPTPDASEAGKTSRSGDRKDEQLIGGLVRKSWPTPQVHQGPNNGENRGEKWGGKRRRLTPQNPKDLIKGWPTPVVSRHGPESNDARKARGANTGTTLVDVVATWPTPQTRDTKECTQNRQRMDALPNVVAQWPTPRNNTGRDQSKKHLSLDGAMPRSWPTPNASDGSGGPMSPDARKKGKSGEKHSTQLVDYIGTPSYGCLATMDTYAERLMNLSAWLMGYTAAYLRHWETRSSRRRPLRSSQQ